MTARYQTYGQRAVKFSNPAAKQLLDIMVKKQTNLAVSADVTTTMQFLAIADAVGPSVCLIKTHIDIIEDFDDTVVERLVALAVRHNFMIFEDRKFADIGNTVALQYAGGVHKIACWAHITNAHPVPGPSTITGLSSVGLHRGRGLLLLAEMSTEGTLAIGSYTEDTVRMARAHRNFVIGFVAQRRLDGVGTLDTDDTSDEDFLVLTPGVGLDQRTDGMGQQYRTPREVVLESGCDIIIVGRGIYERGDRQGILNREDMQAQAERYRREGWTAYTERRSNGLHSVFSAQALVSIDAIHYGLLDAVQHRLMSKLCGVEDLAQRQLGILVTGLRATGRIMITTTSSSTRYQLEYVKRFGGPETSAAQCGVFFPKLIMSSPGSDGAYNIPTTIDLPEVNLLLSNPDPRDAHLHATLQQIDRIANEDVEMQDRSDLLSEDLTLLILDTNILLHHFEMLQQFIADVESLSLPVMVVIPGIVICELDGQKNRGKLAWFARRASQWLLLRVKERRTVKGQANEETCKESRNWKHRGALEDNSSERTNDFLIFDCCQYFHRKGIRTFLCSADKNLCIECEIAGISTITAYPRSSSRDIANALFGDCFADLRKFSGYHASYSDRTTYQATLAQGRVDEDGMDIDDDNILSDTLVPSHALDLLHIQVVEHFTRLLVELVSRVGGPQAHRKAMNHGASLSRYAPSWAQKNYSQYNASDCIEYLESKKPIKTSNPRLDVFLSKPYACAGARRGQDWSPKDWNVALGALAELGDVWNENSIGESLSGLQPHLTAVFAQPMRPTGI